MHFEIIGEIENIETVAVGGRIRDIMRLRKQFGPGRSRKLKAVARVRLLSGRICKAEIHWYEAHSIGKKVIVHRRVAEDAKRMNIFLSAERAERKKLSF